LNLTKKLGFNSTCSIRSI